MVFVCFGTDSWSWNSLQLHTKHFLIFVLCQPVCVGLEIYKHLPRFFFKLFENICILKSCLLCNCSTDLALRPCILMNSLNQSIWCLYRQLTLIYLFSWIISYDTLKCQNIKQFQTILGKFCIEYALNFEICKKDNKIIYLYFISFKSF